MYYYSHGESYGIKEFCKACAGLNGSFLAVIGQYEKTIFKHDHNLHSMN